MTTVARWLGRIPTWVWLFIATTQVLTVLDRSFDLPQLDEAIQQMSQQPAYAQPELAKIKTSFERFRGRKYGERIFATIVASVSIGLAFWSWSQRRRVPEQDAELLSGPSD
jgi:hypothetical protein